MPSQRQSHAERLDVILDVHRRRAEVELAPAGGRLLGEDADFRHQVVADLVLDR